MLIADEREWRKRQSGHELLHAAGYYRMRLARLAALQDGSERPARHSHREDQKAENEIAVEGVRGALFRRKEEERAEESDSHPANGGCMKALAAGEEGLDADHPEGRDGDDQTGDAAGDQGLGENQCGVPDAEGQDAAEADVAKLAAAWNVEAAGEREGHHDAPGKNVADGDELEGGKDSSDIRMPRYVVPQKKHTAANARYGLNRGWRGKFQRTIRRRGASALRVADGAAFGTR